MLDEIAARLRLGDEGADLVVRRARDILDAGGLGLVDVVDLPAQSLPEPRPAWTVSPVLLAAADETRGSEATSHEKPASCPLAWVLEQRARLRSGAITKVASGPLLYGSIGHRLVEELHREATFDLDLPAFMAHAAAQLERLIATEGSWVQGQGGRASADAEPA